ncbi:hypothetical protein BD01_1870 [Thermococcus nautili]|uniref:Uncharacterized protein n=1 Tax=Thermococcus nautili TaxID=195522 RepID=W8NW95_9EURY|nr:hypothetical protein BD01_1870 [Thermococcus nautili]
MRKESQKRFDGKTFSVLFFVNLFMFTVVESLLKWRWPG